MNVVEKFFPNCLVTLRVEVPIERIEGEWEKVANGFQKSIFISGYRKGSAPRELVESQFFEKIRKKLQENLLYSSLLEAVKNRGLKMLSLLEVKDIELRKHHPFRFSAKIVVAPMFELPAYKNITLEVLGPSVSEREVTEVLSRLQQIYISYEPIEGRGLKMGDFAVVSYVTESDGKPLKEKCLKVLQLQPLCSRKYSWIQLDPKKTILPGFSEALLGAQPAERRKFELKVHEDFPYKGLQGKKFLFDVTIEAAQREIVPDWSDQLAAKVCPGKTLQELKSLLLEELKDKANQDFEFRKRQALINFFLSHIRKIQPDLPKHLVESETQSILRDMGQDLENISVSGGHDGFSSQEEVRIGLVKKDAENRIFITFLLLRIAEKENIQVSEEELAVQILAISRRCRIPPPKLLKQLRRKKDALSAVKERILMRKTLDFLGANATFRQPTTLTASG